jgi:hypothetical protein
MANKEWLFVPLRDSIGGDITFTRVCDLALCPPETVAVNTLGFYKHCISLPLVYSPYFKSEHDGIYIRRSALPTEIVETTNEADIDAVELETYLLR